MLVIFVVLPMFDRELSDSRSDDDAKRKSVESLPSHRNVRLSVRPFDDSDDMTTSQHDQLSLDTETAMYSSGSVVWKSSSEAILDVEDQRQQQRGSATDSCSSDPAPDPDGRRVSEHDMVSSESSDVMLSSDCSVSSEQSPVHQGERDDRQSTSPSVSTHDDQPVKPNEVVVLRGGRGENINATTRSCVFEPETAAPDGTGCADGREESGGGLLEEINDHLKQTHGRPLLPAGSPRISANTARRSLDDMSLVDIDTALAEVMSGLELLGRSRGLSLDHSSMEPPRRPAAVVSSSSSSPLGRVASPHTPDLVIGLPQFAAGAQSSTSPRPTDVARSPPAAGQLTTAEMFANVDRCTIKKSGPSTSAPSSAEIWTSPGHPLRVVDSPPPSTVSVGAGMVSAGELPGWSPLRSFGDGGGGGGGGVRTRGSPTRSQSCRVAAERQSDQTWSTLWMTSSEIQRDREFVRNVVPQFGATTAPHQSLGASLPVRDRGVSFDRADLSRFASSTAPGTGSRKDPSTLTHSFIATLPRDVPGGPKTPVKMKPPVMKKPVRSAEMMRRLSEYQQQATDSTSSDLPK